MSKRSKQNTKKYSDRNGNEVDSSSSSSSDEEDTRRSRVSRTSTYYVADNEQPCSSKQAKQRWAAGKGQPNKKGAKKSSSRSSSSGSDRRSRRDDWYDTHQDKECWADDESDQAYYEDGTKWPKARIKKLSKKRQKIDPPKQRTSNREYKKKNPPPKRGARTSRKSESEFFSDSDSWSSVSSFDGQRVVGKDSFTRTRGCLSLSRSGSSGTSCSRRSRTTRKYSRQSPIARERLKADKGTVYTGDTKKIYQQNVRRKELAFDNKTHVLTFNRRMIAHRVGEKIEGFEEETFRPNPLPADLLPEYPEDREPGKGILKKRKKRKKSKSRPKKKDGKSRTR